MPNPKPNPKPALTTEFKDAICGECLDILVNADPDNMGWTEKQYNKWLDKFDRYLDRYGKNEIEEYFDVFPAYSEDGELYPYFTHSGCPICADGLGNTVYPVIVIKERF